MSIFQICYASRAIAPMSSDDLTALLQKARAANHLLNLSGLLLYDDGSFIQLLEGPIRDVRNTYAKIYRDRRHSDIQILYQASVQNPSFPQWDMGFCDPRSDELKQLPGYSNFFQNDFSLVDFRKKADQTRLLFLQFKDGIWRKKLDFHPINVFAGHA